VASSSSSVDRRRARPSAHRPKLGPSAQIPQSIAVSTDARTGGLKDNDDMTKDVVDKRVELAKTIDAGESEQTPWLLLGQVWVVTVVAVLFILGAALFAYRVA